MTAEWMLASAIVGLLLGVAATALGRALALYRKLPLRWIWVAAIAGSLAIPAVWLRVDGRTKADARALPPAMPSPEPGTSTPPWARAKADQSSASLILPTYAISPPSVPQRADRPLFAIWLVMSSALGGLLLAAAWRIRSERSRWATVDLDGVPVLVSPRFGPAVVGIVHQHIVLPTWVLALDEHARRIIVRHEDEHRAARDPALVVGALVALVLMPWNAGLWLQWRGLRRAIEIDCDARVLHHGVAEADYAAVLLGAWSRAHGSWLASTAFAERASGLGARVEHLMRPEPRRRSMKTFAAIAAVLALVAVIGAMKAPARRQRPEAPYPLVFIDGVKRADLPPRFRYVGPVRAETTTSPRLEVRYVGKTVTDAAADKLYPRPAELAEMQIIAAPLSEAVIGPDAKYGAVLYYTLEYRENGGQMLYPQIGGMAVKMADPATPRAAMIDRIYRDLFRDIPLSPEDQQRARAIILAEQEGQSGLRGPVLAIWPRRIALNESRNSALRALVSGTSRETLEQRLAEHVYRPMSIDEVARGMYESLLSRVTIAPEDQSRALARVRAHLVDELSSFERNPEASEERAALRSRLDSDLRNYIKSDAERARYDALLMRMRSRERGSR